MSYTIVPRNGSFYGKENAKSCQRNSDRLPCNRCFLPAQPFLPSKMMNKRSVRRRVYEASACKSHLHVLPSRYIEISSLWHLNPAADFRFDESTRSRPDISFPGFYECAIPSRYRASSESSRTLLFAIQVIFAEHLINPTNPFHVASRHLLPLVLHPKRVHVCLYTLSLLTRL